MPSGQATTAAYLKVRNSGDSSQSIIGASAAGAGSEELHRTREREGMVGMEQLDSVEVAAGGEFEFTPGGTHLMLLGIERMPAPDTTVRLCLRTATGGEACTDAIVRRGGNVHSMHGHGDH